LNISTGGLQFDIKFFGDVNHVTDFHAGPVDAP
jgi:hypothetical protein